MRVTVRLDDTLYAAIAARARDEQQNVSDTIRALIERALFERQQHNSDSGSSAELAQLAQHVAQLTNMLAEHVRVPTFREFRARMFVDERKQATEDDVVRYAKMYYAMYRVWPDIADEATFGASSERLRNIFPRSPN